MVTGPPSRSMSSRAVRRAVEVSAKVAAVRSGLGARAGDVPAAPASGHCVQAAADLLGQPLDTRQVTVRLEADGLALEIEADLVLLLVLTAQRVIGDPGVVLLHLPGGMPEDLANGAAGDTRVRHPGAERMTELMPAHSSRGTAGVDEVDAAHPGVQAGVDGPVGHRVLAVRVGRDLGGEPSAGAAVHLAA